MGERLLKAGWSCGVFSLSMCLTELAGWLFLKSFFSSPMDNSSPGAGIGMIGVFLFLGCGGIFIFGFVGTWAGKALDRTFPRIPAKFHKLGVWGYLLFPLPFIPIYMYFSGH